MAKSTNRTSQGSDPVLHLANIVAYRGGRKVLTDVSLSATAGEIVSLLGANGSGKTSVLLCIAGALRLSSGSILVRGRDVHGEEGWERARTCVTLVPQTDYVYEDLTVEQNLRIATTYAGARERRARIARVAGLWARHFPKVSFSAVANVLSTGETRFLSVLCGVARGTPILLFDEPSAGLADDLARIAFELFQRAAAHGATIVLAEQRRDLALSVADQVVVVDDGAVVWSGRSSAYGVP